MKKAITTTILHTLFIIICAYLLTVTNQLSAMHAITPLMRAIKGDNIPEIELLIASKVDVNEKTKYGLSALALAASKGDLATTVLLLNAGANVREASIDDIHPTLLALAGHHFILAQTLSFADAAQNKKHARNKTLMRQDQTSTKQYIS